MWQLSSVFIFSHRIGGSADFDPGCNRSALDEREERLGDEDNLLLFLLGLTTSVEMSIPSGSS